MTSCCLYLALPILILGCAEPSLVAGGKVLTLADGARPLTREDPGYETTLQVKWLGTACYLIRLGDEVLFTDPFVSHHSAWQVATGTISSDPAKVRAALAGLPAPAAIFVSHSHYDHLLDAAEVLKQPGWSRVPIFGSDTTRNILAGFTGPERNCRNVEPDGKWHEVTPRIRYKALRTEHAIQIPGFPLLYGGSVAEPRTAPPRRADDYQMGGCFNYVFEFSSSKPAAPFVVHFAAGAAGGDPRGWVGGADAQPPDVAMMCVASWRFVRGAEDIGGYPAGFLRMVKPRNVVFAHYDNFFQVNGAAREIVPLADLHGFLLAAQDSADYEGFQKIVMPDVGTWMLFRK